MQGKQLNAFYEKMNNKEFLGKHDIYFELSIPIVKLISPIFLPSIFILFALIYSFNKNNSSVVVRKWPYIVIFILLSLWTLISLFDFFNYVLKDEIILNERSLSSIAQQDLQKIKTEINQIYQKDYFPTLA